MHLLDKQLKPNDDEIGITETYSTASSTVFDSVIVLSDGKEMLPDAIDFAEMSYNHKNLL